MERQNIVARDFLGLNGHNDTEMEVDRQEKKEPPGSGSDHIITLSLFKECEKNYPASGLQLSSGFESNRQGNFQEGIVSGGGSVPYNLGSFLSSTGSRGTTVKTGNASGSVTGERPFAGKPCFHAYNTEMQRSLLRFANSSSVTKENVQPATEKTQMNDVEKFVAAAGKLPDGLTESDIQQREEFRRYFKDKVSVANMAMQWPYWNKATALQQFVSFKDHQEERPEKRRYEQIAASGLHPVAAVDAFKSNQRSAAVTQKAFNLNPISRDSAETGNCYVGVNGAQNRHFVVSPLARTFDGQSFSDNSIEEAGVFAKENLSLCVSNFKEHLGSHVSFKGQQTTATSCATPPMVRSFSGIPVSSQPTVLNGPVGSSVGTAATRVASNGPGKQAGAQLTIFYAGTVNVYDEIPPDKAHTIMLLAGSGSSLFPKNTDPPPQRFAMSTALAMSGHSRPATPTVCSNLSSVLPSVIPPVPPLKSQASLQPSQSTGLSSNSGESHTTENSGSANDSQEAPKQSASGPMPTAVVPRALPQARKASLTRFLEKRKERVPSNMPYPMKKSPSHSLSQREKSLSPTSPFDGLPSSQHDLTGDAVDEKSLTKSDGRKSFFNRDREEQLWSLKAENKNEER